MKFKAIYLIISLLIPFCVFSQESDYRFYSYSELFQMIEDSQDSIFQLSDAFLRYDSLSDARFLVRMVDNKQIYPEAERITIDKEIHLTNIHDFSDNMSSAFPAIVGIDFKQEVHYENCSQIPILNCAFSAFVRVSYTQDIVDITATLNKEYDYLNFPFTFEYCQFLGGVHFYSRSDDYNPIQAGISDSEIWMAEGKTFGFFYLINNQNAIWLSDNTFHGEGIILLNIQEGCTRFVLSKNEFNNQNLRIALDSEDLSRLKISENNFKNPTLLDLGELKQNFIIEWDQFADKLVNGREYGVYFFNLKYYNLDTISGFEYDDDSYAKKNVDHYLDRVRIEIIKVHKAELKLRGKLYNLYKQQHDRYDANSVYVEMKDLETEYLAFLNKQNPSFNTFLTLKINQFLRAFSAYGTRPANAIMFSIYVILFFALIYLFFPNTWDKYGRNRIMNRYRFFSKYINQESGVHEVYLEDKEAELMEFNEFKTHMEASGKTMPKFFLASSLPLYKWAMANSRMTAAFLKRFDIMKGKWSDLPQKKQWWVGALLLELLFLPSFGTYL